MGVRIEFVEKTYMRVKLTAQSVLMGLLALPPSWGPTVGKVAAVSPADKIASRRYLAGPAGHCIECHSPPGPQGAADLENKLGAGGFSFPGPWGVSVATNITPTGLAKYSDADLKRVITTGMRPDGSRLKPNGAYLSMKQPTT